ncbi:tRNA (adenosine(37)-N6)-threonylcarbamoyltransferase complex ATPase subunit type 1 TsaE [Mycoplasma phocimorsus]|uniref:tRNA threonylcarbamoyladenosine biosynthesis protein TsaE n=1 Tax=Mycoplasma phocimorsus TaxID=3045839 RepID=A0AAJ1PS91_9MOLU|nr:tRNA (adenosine(37)-N6)-threonylcarbamoyltransferase complex ATPase subunit type 1 TsaE [Mycoplasma phocimorsus]MDJ1645611.1 tRNA (adenosine(37)-N6)-threonylcarbamoyltransferase complex ATPase subunit type 1 TsaE [Mycoplasma phocimorsus]MDJ1646123.1 tRNA (adenosine(37)-N6)-threonylcarbamoyltransferase complex ATPase subunit type 1 TsaE [Mycoplasma phocimorsus]MDJ1647149.1 tRNA (adenosine(37)-N6)-threonylcarbamoyltransferase complex ATPase subunit type 1 TsaE [Mycoplasma phocimorsus]MDJ164766
MKLKIISSLDFSNNAQIKKIVDKIINNDFKFILLDGELGAGKTTFIKYIAKLLDEKKVVNSPSFNYIKVYDKFIHIDLYNFKGSLEEFEDFFGDKIIIIEWSNLLKEKLEGNILKIQINYNIDTNLREYTFTY